MLERPTLADEWVAAAVCKAFALPVGAAVFLPIGNESGSWAYRLDCMDGSTWFVKLRQGAVDARTFAVTHWLHGHGLPEVVAPLPTQSGRLCAPLDDPASALAGDYSLLLYPWVDGVVGMEAGLTCGQWTELGGFLRRLHAACLPDELADALPREQFRQPHLATLDRVQPYLADAPAADPIAREMAALWRERAGEIAFIAARTRQLGELVRARQLPLVPCHADIHTANVLIDCAGALRVVDWDLMLLAPKERDLMFVLESRPVDGAVQAEQERCWRQGYGEVTVDAAALAYYRFDWVVQELADYGKRVWLMPDSGEATRRQALDDWCALFNPGDVIDAAYAADRSLAAAANNR